MAREINRQAIFLEDQDRERFMGLVSELADRLRMEVHGPVLMENHDHPLVRTLEARWFEARLRRKLSTT